MTDRQGSRGLLRGLRLLLLMGSSLVSMTSLLWPGPAAAAGNPITTFTRHYNYCDAVVLGKFWNVSPDQAKSDGAFKLTHGMAGNLQDAIANARSGGLQCSFFDTGFSYNDAQALAGYWGMASVGEAKTKVALLFSRGDSRHAKQALRQASHGE